MNKLIILLCLLVARSMANGYGSVSISYGQNTPPVVSYGPAEQVRSVYTPPAPVRSYSSAPVTSYGSPPAHSYAAPTHSYAAPAHSYAAPAHSYAAPAHSYAAPAHSYVPAPPATYGTSYGASSEQAPHIPIMHYNHDMQEGKSHHVSYETGHGISNEEHTQIRINPNARGTAEDADAGKATVTKSGSVSYTSPEGKRINLQYTADENGFHPIGDHLPTPPPLPKELVEARNQFRIAYNIAANQASAHHQASQSSNYGYAPPAAPYAPAPSSYGGSSYGYAAAPATHFQY